MNNKGVIGDPHIPADRIGYRQFCRDTFEKYDVDEVVCIGDLVDWHAISFHDPEPQCPGPQDEFEQTYKVVQKWVKTFPAVKWCLGNHDIRPARLAKKVNIPETFLKSYHSLWGLPPEWEVEYSFILDNVLYRHGTGCSGIHPAWNLISKAMRSVVIGHCHAQAGVKYKTNRDHRFFGVDVGCGIDDRKYQFAYGKELPTRPVLACAVIQGDQPFSIVMPCSKGEKYHDSRFTSRSKPSCVVHAKNVGSKRIGTEANYQAVNDMFGKDKTSLRGGGELVRLAYDDTKLHALGPDNKPLCHTPGVVEVTRDGHNATCGNCTKIFKSKLKG
jgi:hypothetical protein